MSGPEKGYRYFKQGVPPLTKFCSERVEKILTDIDAGVPYKIAAEANGVSEKAFYTWITKGEHDYNNEIMSDYANLVQALRQIASYRIATSVKEIRTGGDQYHEHRWLLGRQFWRYFSEKASDLDAHERLTALEMRQDKPKEEPNDTGQ